MRTCVRACVRAHLREHACLHASTVLSCCPYNTTLSWLPGLVYAGCQVVSNTLLGFAPIVSVFPFRVHLSLYALLNCSHGDVLQIFEKKPRLIMFLKGSKPVSNFPPAAFPGCAFQVGPGMKPHHSSTQSFEHVTTKRQRSQSCNPCYFFYSFCNEINFSRMIRPRSRCALSHLFDGLRKTVLLNWGLMVFYDSLLYGLFRIFQPTLSPLAVPFFLFSFSGE